MSTGGAAFFDVDDTVVRGSTALMLGWFLLRRGEIALADMALGGTYYWLRHFFHRLDYDEVIRHAGRLVAGRPFDEVMRWGEECVETVIAGRIYAEAVAAIRHHQEAGRRVVLVSSAPRMVIEALARRLAVPDALYTDGEVEDGIVTGRVLGPVCWGEGKRQLAEAFAATHDLSLAQSYFYTDSVSDLPLLRCVGHPRAVNPDRRLRRIAHEQRWPVFSFRTLSRARGTCEANMGGGPGP